MTKIIIPLGFHYTPLIKNENIPLLEYEPLRCRNCNSVISPLFPFSVRGKKWECPFCNIQMVFPKNYSDFMTDENLPAELLPENSTVEYKLNKKESNFPVFFFLIDTSVEEDELNELKESIQLTINSLPENCKVGIITFGKIVNVIEIGNSEMAISYALNGEKKYDIEEIKELLGLTVRNTNDLNSKNFTNSILVSENKRPKFIMPVGEVSFAINSFLDDLQRDNWQKIPEHREANSVGLAILTAIGILECIARNDPSRILVFLGGPGTVGEGKIVGRELKETIRNFVDFEKGNNNTKYYKNAKNFYDNLSIKLSLNGIILDLFSCCLNQVGLYEMKNLVNNSGGYMIFTDSFSTMIFKDSLKKIFELDENENLKMNFKGKIDFNCTKNFKISGAIGHLHSIETKDQIVSEIVIGEGKTKSWLLGGIDDSSTYTFILDINDENKHYKNLIVQLLTTYIAGDLTTRLRVTTFSKKVIDLNVQNLDVIGNGFDQEAAAVLITRMGIVKNYEGEDSREVLKWIDKILIRLMTKFAKFMKQRISLAP
jgi:protein transport protein SEC23